MGSTVSRDNYAVISAVVEMGNPDTAKELEAGITEKIIENGKSQYENFSASVTLKEFDAETETADYEVEISYTDYGTFYEGCPSYDYYDPPDPAEIDMDDVDDVLYNMRKCIEQSFDDLGFDAETEELEYDIDSLDDMVEDILENLSEPDYDDYEYYE